ncbi:MAG: alpha-L-fucosidase [Anaerolineae bacterium]|nr:alpha-L-fucosidase [Anaerolineae bacterium]
MTINSYWGGSHIDEDHKSTRTLLHYLMRSVAAGANYLLNVGPTAQGQILPIHAQRLRQVGRGWRNTAHPSTTRARAHFSLAPLRRGIRPTKARSPPATKRSAPVTVRRITST